MSALFVKQELKVSMGKSQDGVSSESNYVPWDESREQEKAITSIYYKTGHKTDGV